MQNSMDYMNEGTIPNPFVYPEDLRKLYAIAEQKFNLWLQTREYNKAKTEWLDVYQAFLKKQENLQIRFHKGGILHNIGTFETFDNDLNAAFQSFTLAYIEDVTSEFSKYGGDANEGPAAKNLIGLFRIPHSFLDQIRQYLQRHYQNTVFYNPKNVLDEFLGAQLKKDKIPLKKIKAIRSTQYKIERIPGSWDKRVFIGGSYKELTVINEIRNIVKEKKFIPIVALDCEMPENKIHDFTLLLLHNCKYGIFDVSQDSGHLMEVERTLDYRTEVLLVYQKEPEPEMSKMVSSMGSQYKLKEFTSLKGLNDLVCNFLD